MDEKFVQNINNYLESLQREEPYNYFPSRSGLTKSGRNLQLGFSCYALKCFYITKQWDTFSEDKKNKWIDFINSFQKNIADLPNNSFIDDEFIANYKSFNFKNKTKNVIKKNLSLFNLHSYESPKTILENNIRAETKQAISTLYQVGGSNSFVYNDFPTNKDSIFDFLNSFNWNKPWHAGAQYSALCVFISTQLEGDVKHQSTEVLKEFIDYKLNHDNGFYYSGNFPSSSELINGSMKVLTGLDWLGVSIHKPEKIIDYCLLQTPSSEGCDLVDIVYVLYRCSLETDYKRDEISQHFNSLKDIIFSHYKNNEFGFSYYLNKSQRYYYGLNITTGKNVADLHGTLLLLWAISMIYDFETNENELFNIIKP